MVSGGRPLIDIVYKYNVQKFLSFIVTYNSRSTQAGLPYLSKYPDKFYNAIICLVDSTLFMYKLFGSVNEVGLHNKSSQSDLAL